MADKKSETIKNAGQQEEDIVGKAYDSRLMARLIVYLRPYKLQAAVSLVAIVLKAGSDVLGPYLTKVAVDRYMTARPPGRPAAWTRWLSPNAFTGITEIAGLLAPGRHSGRPSSGVLSP